ncbi:hypothetical protein CRG98_038709 [Punica granatum]|uniref:Uncharacterized protein n=1 Tax=Punica granatum TaxID=22663 RepID=A0A2I0IAA2_PUNGR|nr:hypothetical protein CRG98_038709 [Punica granatum]
MSERVSRAYRLSRDTPDLSRTPFLTGLPGSDPLTRFPDGRFNGNDRLPVNLRGTFTENRDHSDSRKPQDIWGTLRKPRSQVPRSSRGNGLRSGTTSQRSPTRQKAHRDKHYNSQRSNRGTGTVNSSLNAQTGQNRLSRRRVTQTFVHMTYGDIRLSQILFVQAFQIY